MSPQLRLKLDRNAPFRREDFITSEDCRPSLDLLDAWPNWRGGALALVGPAGTGKTHLATAWAERSRARAGRSCWRTPTRPGLEELLFHLINMAAHPGASLLLTARTAPTAWPADKLPDLRSRLNALPVAVLAEPDDVVLTQLLDKFFRERNIKPPEDLLPYLVWRIERSALAAREIVAELDEKADAGRRPVSKALAREILEARARLADLQPN